MSKVHQIIEDVLTVALYDEKSAIPDVKRQIEHSLSVIIPKRTPYKRAVVCAQVNTFKGTARVQVDLFDSNIGDKKVAEVEYIHPVREEQPIKARKL